ncbi:hypothetical protein [Xanthomonas arboricola]|nr:hypothetical protein [Xanthomonas arboricola]MBB3762783.1 hypothetical protein [Xanthomonas arboricola]
MALWKGRIYGPASGKTGKTGNATLTHGADGFLTVAACVAFFRQGPTW